MEKKLSDACFRLESKILTITLVQRKTDITAAISEGISQERLVFQEGCPYPAMVIFEGCPSFSRDGRIHFMTEGIRGIKALALVADNSVKQTLSAFLVNKKKTAIPCRIFIDEGSAIRWLRRKLPNNTLLQSIHTLQTVSTL